MFYHKTRHRRTLFARRFLAKSPAGGIINFEFSPLLSGGGQQGGLRSGTENPMGIYTLKLALEDLILGFNFEKILEAKKYIENSLIEILGNKGEIVAYNAKMRNLNTIYFIQKMIHPEILKMKFDLGGMDVGLGSACSSGSPLPDRIILALGYDNESAKSGIRLSFEPYLELETAKIYLEKIKSVFKNSLK